MPLGFVPSGFYSSNTFVMGKGMKEQSNPLEGIPSRPQRQDSSREQLADLIAVANRLGMYDAADQIKLMLEGSSKQG
jgi:hypothetical protein